MTIEAPDPGPAAEDASMAARETRYQAPPTFPRTRAALQQYECMINADRAATTPTDEGGPGWSATTRLPTLLAVGGIALAALIAAYLPFARMLHDAGAPEGEIALQNQASTHAPALGTAQSKGELLLPEATASSDLRTSGTDRMMTTADHDAGADPRSPSLLEEAPGPAADHLAKSSSTSTFPVDPPSSLILAAPNVASPQLGGPLDRREEAVQDSSGRTPSASLTAPHELSRAGVTRESEGATAARSSVPVTIAPGDAVGSSQRGTGEDQKPHYFVFRVQLVSVSEESAAHRAWTMYKRNFAGLLAQLEPVIERAEVAGRRVFRVQAGSFLQRPDAEKICQQLKDRGADCFVVTAARAR
jgi:SPOR domain